jgi:hypothetical protein
MLVAAMGFGAVAWAFTGPLPAPTSVRAQATDGSILAVVGRQVAWLNLEAPRHRMISHIASPANALDVTARGDGSGVIVAVGGPFPGGGPRGADLVALDAGTGDITPIAQRAEPRESLNSPAWWPDGETLLFERQDLGGQPVGAPGQEVPRYPSRIERVLADGSERSVILPDGRQPDAAPDGTRLVFARTTNQGASLLSWHQADGTVQTLVPEGRFADVAYPRFSPSGERIAFVAPQSGVGALAQPGVVRQSGIGVSPAGLAGVGLDLAALFGPSVALAHGIPWDPWLMNADGSNLHRAAETFADEPSVSWSPDGNQLFVYSGTGSFIVDAGGGGVTPLPYVQGYGPTVWLASSP